MTDRVHRLTPGGVEIFKRFIVRAAQGEKSPPPTAILFDPRFSEPTDLDVSVDNTVFSGRYEFGIYLNEVFKGVPAPVISRDHGLWNWLALYWFEQLAPERADGSRKIYRIETLILPSKPDYSRYYRHFVRTPWLAVSQHGEVAKVLLVPAGGGKEPPLTRRGELVEQLSSRQWIFGNRTIMRGAYDMYFDPTVGRPKRGAGGSVGGSPRRLATIVDQLELTWDLHDCTPQQFVALLPKEFDRWRPSPA